MNASSYFFAAVLIAAVFPIVACVVHWRLRGNLSALGTLLYFACYAILVAGYSASVFAVAEKCGYIGHFDAPLSLLPFSCASLPFLIFYALFYAAFSANANPLKIGVYSGDSERLLDRFGGWGASFPFGYIEFCEGENIAVGVKAFSFRKIIRQFSADAVLSAQVRRVSFQRVIVLRFPDGTPKCVVIFPMGNFDKICQELSRRGVLVSANEKARK